MKTADEIFEEMKTVFETETGHRINADCDMGVRMYASACQAEALYIYGQWVMRQYFPQTAEGEYLESHAAVRGLSRRAAVKAVGEIRFSVKYAADENIAVPAGTVCMTAEGVGFVTVKNGTIPRGETSCTVMAEAVEGGKGGNAASKTIIYMSHAPAGVESCVNPYGFTGGTDIESDDELRERVMKSYKTLPNGANAAWYEKTALEIKGVAAAKAIPCARGAGTVDVIIASDGGTPSAKLISEVSALFEDKRELGIDVQVSGPTIVKLNIDVEVKPKAGFAPSAVFEDVESALNGLFTGALLGETLYVSDIYDRIYHTEGVEGYRVKTPASSYSAAPGTLLRAGTITVGRWK